MCATHLHAVNKLFRCLPPGVIVQPAEYEAEGMGVAGGELRQHGGPAAGGGRGALREPARMVQHRAWVVRGRSDHGQARAAPLFTTSKAGGCGATGQLLRGLGSCCEAWAGGLRRTAGTSAGGETWAWHGGSGRTRSSLAWSQGSHRQAQRHSASEPRATSGHGWLPTAGATAAPAPPLCLQD